MKKQISSARMSSIGYFSAIVKENHKKLLRLDDKLKTLQHQRSKSKIEDDELERKIFRQEYEIAKISFIVIVFSVMITESYIYDYAARHLGDSYVKKHLDQLDTFRKWIKIPKLITGKELSRRQLWASPLQKIIKVRNKITHHKTQDVSIENYQKSLSSSNEVKETALQSISLLQILADKISEIDPEETPWVQSFLY
jgi:hypothetical protein